MQPFNITCIKSLLLLLAALGSALGQGTIHVTFDGPPTLPSGSVSSNWNIYSESGLGVHHTGGGFTRRSSGDPQFPDNGTAYLQPGSSPGLYFDYIGGGRPFNAVSVDLALFSASSMAPATVQFVGFAYGGPILGTAEFTVTLDGQGRPAFQTFSFPQEFAGMHSLWIAPSTPLWSLDNLVFSTIPEPSAFALLVAAGLLLWAWRRRGSGMQYTRTRCPAHGSTMQVVAAREGEVIQLAGGAARSEARLGVVGGR